MKKTERKESLLLLLNETRNQFDRTWSQFDDSRQKINILLIVLSLIITAVFSSFQHVTKTLIQLTPLLAIFISGQIILIVCLILLILCVKAQEINVPDVESSTLDEETHQEAILAFIEQYKDCLRSTHHAILKRQVMTAQVELLLIIGIVLTAISIFAVPLI